MHPTRLTIAPTAFVAPGAILVGEVSLGDRASVWYGCVLRGDIEPIRIGPRTNIQDGTVVHVDIDQPAIIGSDVSIGHRSVVHGCVVEDGAMIGMGAVVLSGARIGSEALIAAGAVVTERFVVPARALVAGVPGKVVGELDDALLDRVRFSKDHYVAVAARYLAGELGGGPHGGR